MSDDQDGCEWVSFLLVPAYPGSPRPAAIKRLCVCVVSIPDVITFANFGDDWLRVFGWQGGQISLFSTGFYHCPYNTVAPPC